MVRCDSGDDFIVCSDSQAGGLAGSHVSHFHYQNASAQAIHLDSICNEAAPNAAAERLLNTPTTSLTTWGGVLPAAPRPAVPPVAAVPGRSDPSAAVTNTVSDGIFLALGKRGDDVTLSFNAAATRLWKALNPALTAGICLSVSGGVATDAHQLSSPASAYYAVGSSALCSPSPSFAAASLSPAAGRTSGAYTVTLLGRGFDATVKVRVGSFFASRVVVVNDTTLTFRMPPGPPGPETVTVINGAEQSASASFTYVEPGPVAGAVAIIAPSNGTTVTSGSTISVSALGSGGFTIATAFAVGSGIGSSVDHDPGERFTTNLTIPPGKIGPFTIGLIGKDANGNLKAAAPVTVNVVAPASAELVRLDAERLILLSASPTEQLRVFGIYSDGVRRELTHVPGILYEMDTLDVRKPNYPYNGTGVAIVDTAGLVTAKTRGTTVCHVTYQTRALDVVVEVAGIRPTITLQKPGFISWPFQGASVTYDLVRGKLSGLRATGGNFSDPSIGLTCIKDNFTNVTAADIANPPAGEGYFYLMRDSSMLSYEESPFWATRSQNGQRTAEINASPGGCP